MGRGAHNGGLRERALRALESAAFRQSGGEIAWSDDIGLPITLTGFLQKLGGDAEIRERAVAASASYSVRYTIDQEMFEETGTTLPDGSVTGILRKVYSTPEPDWELLSERDILDALNDRRVKLAFQPIVSAATGNIHHYECLLRMLDVHGRVLPAGQVIESAETLGLVHLLDRRTLETAARTLIGRRDLNLALNVSAQTVADRAASDDYIDALRMLGSAASRLTIELTETVAINDPTMAARFASATRGLGCRFAIDDFGSGYTTFRNLMAIEADAIKIDGDFVDGLVTSRRAQTFIRMMVDLARTFGVDTVAERVETQEVAELLTEFGVDYLQGYLFGKPTLDRHELKMVG